jgi:hypothetical protein
MLVGTPATRQGFVAGRGQPRLMRELLVLAYGFLTAIICVQAMLGSSFRVGAEALVEFAMNFAGAAIFFAVFLARHEKNASRTKLIGAGAIALVLIAAAFALMIQARFWIYVYDGAIPGAAWLVVGLVAALLWASHRRARAMARW